METKEVESTKSDPDLVTGSGNLKKMGKAETLRFLDGGAICTGGADEARSMEDRNSDSLVLKPTLLVTMCSASSILVVQ